MKDDPLFSSKSTLVLGVGNVLWADEGVGAKLVNLLDERYDIPDADLVDGGTQGLYLLPHIAEAEYVLLLDAVKTGRPAGTIIVLKDEEIDTVFRGAISLHDTTLHDLLASVKLIGRQPRQVILIGIEAEETGTWGGDLTSTVARAMDEALIQAIACLHGWGVSVTDKTKTTASV